MISKLELNLVGVISPLCLLECKSFLRGMNSGEVVEVLIEDPDVVEELVIIIGRSADRVIDRQKENDRYRVCLRKN